MGVEFKSPGDRGHNPWGKKHQIHVSGWGCVWYPLLLIIATLLTLYTDGWFLILIPSFMLLVFLYGLYTIFTNNDPLNFFD